MSGVLPMIAADLHIMLAYAATAATTAAYMGTFGYLGPRGLT